MDLLNDCESAVSDLDLDYENKHGMFSNFSLFCCLLASVRKNKPFPVTKPVARPVYDYIIVGAGPAGSVMAHRLSENTCRTVLLLEAGSATPYLTDVPATSRLFLNTDVDWVYKTEPQKYAAFGHCENRVIWNSGKGLGGSSMINAMMYVRGNKRDYDRWEAEGCTGWGYNDVFPYFLKLEDNKDIAKLDEGYHREGGPQTAERVNYTPEIKYPFMEAMKEMGYKDVDSNGRQQTGIFNLQALLRNQQRCSASKAYLVPAENRPNLDIVKGAFVTEILFENERATGVKYDLGTVKGLIANATKEVIVSAGSVRTAQLLMLSGIGPREELEKHNIEVKVDLPVGKNLQDHYASSLYYLVNDTIQNVYAKTINPENIMDYIINRRGPLAAPSQVTLLAFTSGTNGSSITTDHPRQELHIGEYVVTDPLSNSNLKKGVYKKYFAPYVLKALYICFVGVLNPESRGDIRLKSKNPYDHPLINPNYFQDEKDLRDIVEGFEVCDAVARSEHMKKVQARPLPIAFPGCEEEFERDKTEYYYCHARQSVSTVWHPVGVARMGQPNDTRSVVDPQLCVIGVEGLRVINAAVMPIIPSGNTNVPTLMVAEKAYDMMKDEAKCPDSDPDPEEINLF